LAALEKEFRNATRSNRRQTPEAELAQRSERIMALRQEITLTEGTFRAARREAVEALLATAPPGVPAGLTYCEYYTADFAGGWETIQALAHFSRALRHFDNMERILRRPDLQELLRAFAHDLSAFIAASEEELKQATGLATREHEELNRRLIELKDSAWRISVEVLGNVERIRAILPGLDLATASSLTLREAMATTLVLNEIDRLEFRGRDSAGTSKMILFPNRAAYQAFLNSLTEAEKQALAARQDTPLYESGAIRVREARDGSVVVSFVHKYASVIGDFGENTARIRAAMAQDTIFQKALLSEHEPCPGIAHTRWASVGIINEQNCHPVDNTILCEGQPYVLNLPEDSPYGPGPAHIFACLNGDIMEYLQLRDELEQDGRFAIQGEITTDTKIIPVRVQHYLAQGHLLEDAFRLAVSDFAGSSYAIAMHSDLEPRKLFVAMDGSGQAAYVALSQNGPVVASEIYGFVEQTQRFIQVQGGQVFVIDQSQLTGDELSGLRTLYHDGTPFQLFPADVQTTEITSRDIDKRGFSHFLRKELEEAMESFEKTTRGKIGVRTIDGKPEPVINLGEEIVPRSMLEKVRTKQYRHIICSGMGTAAAAAYGFGEQMARDLNPGGEMEYLYDDQGNVIGIRVESVTITITASIATEVSGFQLRDDMSDTLLILVTQSGTTADTLSALDRAKERGADFVCIVNRRDSDITSRVEAGRDGCVYTSDGRDPEVAVASTKAYYAQVAAGKILSLAFAQALGTKSPAEMVVEIEELLELPRKMERVLTELDPWIEQVAQVATTRKEYGIAASGFNRSGAREARIKIAELTHKAVSEDHLEDIKHIYLSARPLLLLLLAGIPAELIADSAQEVAYFKAHNAAPVVIASESMAEAFREYAYEVIGIPETRTETAALILNVLAGHLFCYHACRAINRGSLLLARISNDLAGFIADRRNRGQTDAAILADPEFRRKAQEAFATWLQEVDNRLFDASLSAKQAGQLTALFQAVASGEGALLRQAGLLEADGSVLDRFLDCLSEAVKETARYIDAIREQAKTVTVGAKRVEQQVEEGSMACQFR
jgi:glucosamine--fructose-6-phosphate aminotransferase (isomerizing)